MTAVEHKRRWFRISPDRFALGLLVLVCLLWLANCLQLFGLNHHKGLAVIVAVAAVGIATITTLLCWGTGLIFARRFRFGIRSLLAFCIAASTAVGWLAVDKNRAGKQKEAVETVKRTGQWLDYDWQVDAKDHHLDRFFKEPEPPIPDWLRTTLGVDFFSTVIAIHFPNANVTDTALEQLKNLPTLRAVWLQGTNVSDSGLGHLASLPQLRSLDLSFTHVTDAGLANIAELSQLRLLLLHDTRITDAGLEHLKGLTKLRSLILMKTLVTDGGLEHLKGLTTLQDLDLMETRVTDTGLDHLKNLSELRSLFLTGTRVTSGGREALNKALPKCVIYYR